MPNLTTMAAALILTDKRKHRKEQCRATRYNGRASASQSPIMRSRIGLVGTASALGTVVAAIADPEPILRLFANYPRSRFSAS